MIMKRLNLIICLLLSLFLTACFQKEESEPEKETTSAPERSADPEIAKLEEEKEDLENQIEQIEDDLENVDVELADEIEAVERLEEIRKYGNAAERLHGELALALEKWREATRKSFVGVKLREIVTVGGDTYSNVTITNVTDDTLTFEHSGGMQTLEIITLPVQLRMNLIHEPTVLASRGAE